MKFTENNKLGDILSEHYRILLLLGRFGISLGFGDKTVKAVCAEYNVDCQTFLAVVNYMAMGDSTLYRNVDVQTMLQFLRRAHTYYVDFLMPELRQKLEGVASRLVGKKLYSLTMRLFDAYAAGVQRHFAYENSELFSHADRLAAGERGVGFFDLTNFISQHENLDTKLLELKNVMVRYFPAGDNPHEVNQVLFDLFAFEADLRSHCDIEDNLLIPALMEMERRSASGKRVEVVS